MKKEQIQAIGIFLTYYYEDLNYIKNFQDFKENSILLEEYVKKDKGTFYSFLIEFKVTRNFVKGTVDKLLLETLDFVRNSNPEDVDLFAKRLAKTELTRGNTTTSLASKILFLNNPWKIIPMDTLTRKTLKQNENKYSTYQINLTNYCQKNKTIIEECLVYTKPLTTIIENEFSGKIKDLDVIRENRIIDKLLWATRENGNW